MAGKPDHLHPVIGRPRKVELSEFARLYLAGVRMIEIELHFGVVRTTLKNARKKLQLPPRPKGWRPLSANT